MAFLFGKSKKGQASALPAATRDISSSHGAESRIPTSSGADSPRDGMPRRGTVGTQQTPPQSASVNSSFSSASIIKTPEPDIKMRNRAESDLNPRTGSSRGFAAPGESPYPWSQRPLEFSAGLSPFPRYGAAVNAGASKEGWIYVMGGLVNSQVVKGDLWMVELATGRMACYPVNATAEGPCPRVGHASLLVGNAFIVFGGDTKTEEADVLDDTLYLLNTATKAWSRASPAGPKPSGRYGHTLNILGSKLYIFGGQVEGYFFNDLVSFDLNTLQSPGNRWEIMIHDRGANGRVLTPPPRTNHSVVTWQDKLYMFGGTDGNTWFNDVWTYDPSTNAWSELDCIGYIPTAREGHAAALVNDTMYIFGGRVQDGTDLGDLAAFRISTRRWYMFQNMGPSPSPRSGHSMTTYGKHIVVLAGEPSSAPRDAEELSIAYILDTSKIRYPPTEQQPNQQAPVRKLSIEQRSSPVPQSKGSNIPIASGQQYSRAPEPTGVNGIMGTTSRLPRQPGTTPSPTYQQGMQAPRSNGGSTVTTPRSRTPTKPPPNDIGRSPPYDRENVQPGPREYPPIEAQGVDAGYQPAQYTIVPPSTSRQGSVHSPSRSGSHTQRQQDSLDSTTVQTPSASEDQTVVPIREVSDVAPVDSGVGSSPALSQQTDELMRELEAAKSRNAWYAAELALARKAGYHPSSSGNPILDQQAADVFGDDDRPLIEALLRMRSELARIQGSMDAQAEQFTSRVAEIERQRDAAVSEAAYAKARFAAQGGSGHGDGTLQQFDMPRGASASPDVDRVNEISKRLAAALTQQQELKVQFEQLSAESEAERRARMLAEEGADAAQRRVSELEAYRQRDAAEVESLRSQLHESQRVARESEVACADALASSRSIQAEHRELSGLRDVHIEELKRQAIAFQKLQEALKASTEKADSFEQKHGEEQERSVSLEQKHAQLRSDHENLMAELESAQRRLRDAEEFGNKHAAEARTHRDVILSGLDSLSLRNADMDQQVVDERVTLLQQQLDTANTIIHKRQAEVDSSADRLRVAEERIAGLEAYQEQSSRESLAIRKQLQQSLREGREIQQEKNDVVQSLERAQLEKNALEVQYKTLKNLLEERGISPSDVRRSRGLDSPTTRYGTPEFNKIRELERQLDEALKAHEELRLGYEQREQEVSREWEEKLAALDNDHQGAVKYVRGLEKMLAKMKQELQKTKSANMELEKEIAAQKAMASTNAETAPPQDWQAEREQLRSDMAAMEDSLKASVSALESQIRTLNASLADAHQQRDDLSKAADDSRQRHDAAASRLAQSTREIEAMRQENAMLLARATDAEGKVQLFLDQFESSVDNYRRRSRTAVQNRTMQGEGGRPNGVRHGAHESISGASLYSTTTAGDEDDDDDDDDDDGTSTGSGRMTPNANVGSPHGFTTVGFTSGVDVTAGGEGVGPTGGKHERDRSSTALDSLANELDALRTRWETTNKSYRLSDRFEFDRSPLTPTLGMGTGLGLGVGVEGSRREGERAGVASGEGNGRDISLASWRRRLEEGDDDDEKENHKASKGESSLGPVASAAS